ncbi:MAG: bifunctional enoyl-CoA hydratase/phosphate acetyltransferase [Solobacterium sp.]|nr:bifunctional enoyl-CoA hydratase/phosphate acetyltransferase [Solobacterium sp.]
MIRNFEEIRSLVLSRDRVRRLGVIGSHETHALEAAAHAMKDGIVIPVLYGKKEETIEKWEALGTGLPVPEIVDCQTDEEIAECAIRAAHDGKVDCLLKGKVYTQVFLRAVLNKEWGLRTGRQLSHVLLMQVGAYHKMLFLSDAGMVPYPDLKTKKDLILNASDICHKLGYEQPKVAVLASVERVNPKMPETVDAHALKEMNQNGEITGCVVEGPISFDLAISSESVQIKEYESPVAGDADILIVPEITTGNVLFKALSYFSDMTMGGIIVGARVPISMISRASSGTDKYNSILVAAAVSGNDTE